MDENDEKPKLKFSLTVVKKTPQKKKKKDSKSLQARQEMSKLKDQHFKSVQNLSSEFEKFESDFEKIPSGASTDKESLPLSPVLGFCAKCGNNFNKVALLMLHKKGLYGQCLKVKRKKHEAQELEIDLIQPFRRFTMAEGFKGQ